MQPECQTAGNSPYYQLKGPVCGVLHAYLPRHVLVARRYGVVSRYLLLVKPIGGRLAAHRPAPPVSSWSNPCRPPKVVARKSSVASPCPICRCSLLSRQTCQIALCPPSRLPACPPCVPSSSLLVPAGYYLSFVDSQTLFYFLCHRTAPGPVLLISSAATPKRNGNQNKPSLRILRALSLPAPVSRAGNPVIIRVVHYTAILATALSASTGGSLFSSRSPYLLASPSPHFLSLSPFPFAIFSRQQRDDRRLFFSQRANCFCLSPSRFAGCLVARLPA